ncbi:UDP-N-acetylmuramate--alanine ligase [Cognatiyoonia koreensis]|nr:UDP-N-acetylmuramate--alanine ligase [Cognatiyoonia koreensis]
MIWMTYLMVRGRAGLVLTVLSLLGALLAILVFATGTPIGIDPLQAWTIALLFVLPAMCGALAGTLLGWLIRWRRERRG